MEFLYWGLGFVLLLSACITILAVFQKKRVQKRKNDIIKLFTLACKKKNITDFKMEYVKKSTHDFYFENEKHIYYIKVIYNFSNQEICINNAIKWQLRKLGEVKQNMTFEIGRAHV